MDLNNIYNYWFEKKPKDWFCSGTKYDNEIKELFEEMLLSYNKDIIYSKNSKSILSLIILLDQFPRHIYRNQKKSFDYDIESLKIVLDNFKILDNLNDWEKVFFLMPLKHQENYEIQKLNVLLWENINKNNHNNIYNKALKNSIEHLNIIKKFNRFPKRNLILNRNNTTEEKEYLLNRNNTFI